MAVIAFRELVGRTLQHRFGESPTAQRTFNVTLDQPTSITEIASAIGIFHLSPHPEYVFLRMFDAQLTESDREHAQVVFSYEVPKEEDLDPNPLARPDIWSFSTSGSDAILVAEMHRLFNAVLCGHYLEILVKIFLRHLVTLASSFNFVPYRPFT